MSIDEIIKHIDEDAVLSYRGKAAYAWVELQHIPKIVALLKAGQAMAEDLADGDYHSKQAWDAAIGGEV